MRDNGDMNAAELQAMVMGVNQEVVSPEELLSNEVYYYDGKEHTLSMATSRNQVWLVTHGPGCRPDYVHSDTIHLRHPVDGDRMAVGRGDVWGVPKPEMMDCIRQAYPEFDAALQPAVEPDEELCR